MIWLLALALAAPPQPEPITVFEARRLMGVFSSAVQTEEDLSQEELDAEVRAMVEAALAARKAWEKLEDSEVPSTRKLARQQLGEVHRILAEALHGLEPPEDLPPAAREGWIEDRDIRAARQYRSAADRWRQAAGAALHAGQKAEGRRLWQLAREATAVARELEGPVPPPQPIDPTRQPIVPSTEEQLEASRQLVERLLAECASLDDGEREELEALSDDLDRTFAAGDRWAMPALLVRAHATLQEHDCETR